MNQRPSKIFLVLFLASCSKSSPIKEPEPVASIDASISFCDIPEAPVPPPAWGGVPVYGTGGTEIGTIITTDGIKEIGEYLIMIRNWMVDVRSCFEPKR
jgi:hypothetical protein